MERREHIEEGNAIGPSEDGAHRLLAAGRRRLALETMAAEWPVGLEALSEDVVRREGRDDGTERTVERVAVDRYHRHLPLMADLGAIEYDRGSRRVEDSRIGVGVRSMDRRVDTRSTVGPCGNLSGGPRSVSGQ